jgi:hypothetical protein
LPGITAAIDDIYVSLVPTGPKLDKFAVGDLRQKVGCLPDANGERNGRCRVLGSIHRSLEFLLYLGKLLFQFSVCPQREHFGALAFHLITFHAEIAQPRFQPGQFIVKPASLTPELDPPRG